MAVQITDSNFEALLAEGKPVVVDFWATWCGPCQHEMPDIQALYEDHGSNSGDIIILSVAQPDTYQEGSAEEIAAFMEEHEYTYPVLMDRDGLVFYYYGIRAFPTTYMISADGTVFRGISGAMPRELMDDFVDQTITGELR